MSYEHSRRKTFAHHLLGLIAVLVAGGPSAAAAEPVRLAPFLHEIVCTNTEPAVFERLCERCLPQPAPAVAVEGVGCTSGVKGRYFGRNYDWMLSSVDEYLVRVPARGARHASVGMASAGTLDAFALFAVSVTDDERRACLPQITMDGVNDAGVAASCHFVSFHDVGWTKGTRPGAPRMVMSRFVRAVLDTCDSAHAATNLVRTVNLYAVPGFEVQWLVADASGASFHIGVVSNRVTVTAGVRALTNYNPAQVTACGRIPALSSGLERRALMERGLSAVASSADMDALLQRLHYSHYVRTDGPDPWWSELNGTPNLVRDRFPKSPAFFYHDDTNDYAEAAAARRAAIGLERETLEAGLEHLRRTGERPPKADSWMTLHSCVYDLRERSVAVRILEGDEVLRFPLRWFLNDR